MKNIHVLPTEKPSRLIIQNGNKLILGVLDYSIIENRQHIYITNSEDIKDVRQHKGKWHLEKGQILNKFPNYLTDLSECKLVIMTTDQDLIKDGVQAIDANFLEWFVKNPSCEHVSVQKRYSDFTVEPFVGYKIIIPQEEPKQDLEKAIFNLEEELDIPSHLRLHNSKTEQERMYSEEEVLDLLYKRDLYLLNRDEEIDLELPSEWFEQFKKK
jgi:hypothetical protein